MRATLAERAPTEISVASGWAAVAGRLSGAHQNDHAVASSDPPAPVSLLGAGPRTRARGLPRLLTRVAAAVAVAAVLMGAGFGIAYYLSTKGNLIQQRHLYTVVNQRQSDQGVTVVVDRAYADSGSTSVLYYIELSPALAARGYTSASPLTFSLTDQYGDEGGAGNIICHPGSGSVLETCEMDSAPVAVPAGATQLTFTFTVSRVVLVRGGDHERADTVQGDWAFQFTVPFHQPSLGPGGPYVQPAGRAHGAGNT